MKKILIILFLSLFTIHAFSQISGKSANKRWELGILGTYMHFKNDVTRGGVGFNFMYHGIYVDYMGWTSSHGSDVKVGKWKEETCKTFHAGYQIPINRNFRIIPVIGYAVADITYTDGHNWSVTSSGISNSQYAAAEDKGFDFGAVFCVNIKKVDLFAACTAHNFYGGIGLEF